MATAGFSLAPVLRRSPAARTSPFTVNADAVKSPHASRTPRTGAARMSFVSFEEGGLSRRGADAGGELRHRVGQPDVGVLVAEARVAEEDLRRRDREVVVDDVPEHLVLTLLRLFGVDAGVELGPALAEH